MFDDRKKADSGDIELARASLSAEVPGLESPNDPSELSRIRNKFWHDQGEALYKIFCADPSEVYNLIPSDRHLVQLFKAASRAADPEVVRVWGSISNNAYQYPAIREAVVWGTLDQKMMNVFDSHFIHGNLNNAGWGLLHDLPDARPDVGIARKLDMLDILLNSKRPPDLNASVSNGFTPLHEAILKGDLDLVRAYLDRGASPVPTVGGSLPPIDQFAEKYRAKNSRGDEIVALLKQAAQGTPQGL